jgi:carbon-monoxide dehydrogenase iron sulfur subunit
MTYAPIACRHCVDAPCVYACIAGARQRTSDGIRIEEGDCVACGSCYMVCPIGAITRHAPTGRYGSCDRCGDADPHCVRACPTGALQALEAEEEQSAFFELVDQNSEVRP